MTFPMALLLAACLLAPLGVSALPISFNHGVASGDPTSSRIILWTR